MFIVGRERLYEGYKLLRFRAQSNKLPEKIFLPGVYHDKIICSVGLRFFPEAFDQHHGCNPLLRLLRSRPQRVGEHFCK